ncbi:MAG: glycosyltransferase family 4 protein, partial [Candidatus Dormibacteraceae bacterium]
RPLSKGAAGISRVTRCLLDALQQTDTRNEYVLFSNRPIDFPLKSARWKKVVDSHWRSLPGTIWLLMKARRDALRENVEVFWGPQHAVPLGLPGSIRTVVTIHDVVWLRYPERMSAWNKLVHRALAGRFVRSAGRIIAVSESTKDDVRTLLGVPESKIQVVYNGVSDHFRPHERAGSATYINQKYGTTSNYLCALGTVEPRKNLPNLIRAFAALRERHNLPVQLVIAGARGWKNSAVFETMRSLRLTDQQVKFLGFVPDEDLPILYSGAQLFVFPSTYEGFGLPLLEAMACGTPVVCTDRSSPPEVCGPAAVYFDPDSVEDMTYAMLSVLESNDVREKLISAGLERAKRFTWKHSAENVLSILESAF